MVSTVINPLKRRFRFIDLLKPEIEAVMPVLLAIEPGARGYLTAIAARRQQARSHRLRGAAVPAYDDIAAAGSVDPLRAALEGPLKGDVDRFFVELGEPPLGTAATSEDYDQDIASWRQRGQRAAGIGRLLVSRGDDEGARLETRLPALLMAMRALRGDNTFDRGVETLTEYEDAAEALSGNGSRIVVFGHTHLARDITLKNGARYLNSGTWADLLTVPTEIVSQPPAIALAALRDFAADLRANRLRKWLRFAPTYVHLRVNEDGVVADAALRDYTSTVEP
jgi:hypothetical protein